MQEEVTDRIFTAANVISFIRLIMAFVSFFVLIWSNNIVASILFALTALTDFIDGQVARRTHTVSRLGQLLDPAVDRILMILGVVGLLILGWLPLWIVVVVIARDLLLLVGGAWLLRNYRIRVPVIYAGKVATTFLFVGLAGLMLNMPQLPGLGWCDFAWLPGFNMVSSSWGIWAIYVGLAIGIVTTVYYVATAICKLREACHANAHVS